MIVLTFSTVGRMNKWNTDDEYVDRSTLTRADELSYARPSTRHIEQQLGCMRIFTIIFIFVWNVWDSISTSLLKECLIIASLVSQESLILRSSSQLKLSTQADAMSSWSGNSTNFFPLKDSNPRICLHFLCAAALLFSVNTVENARDAINWTE